MAASRKPRKAVSGKSKAATRRHAATKLEVRDLEWGCIYHGKKRDIVSTGLLREQDFPKLKNDYAQADVLSHEAPYRQCSVEYQGDDIWAVSVNYLIDEISPQRLLARAAIILAEDNARTIARLKAILPPPLSEVIGIKAAQEVAS